MRPRPRCRSWLPLSTQQLRLRNLIRIQGVNIKCNEATALIYYTLHHTKEGAAFYLSEALPQRQQQQKWAEIVCPELLKSNANCVCVKVWARPTVSVGYTSLEQLQKLDSEQLQPKEPISALSRELSNICLNPSSQPRPPDKLIFSWAVYFSGLIPLSQQTDAKCTANSLLFYMNGECFASPEHFTVDSLREQLSLNYERYSASVPKDNRFLAGSDNEFGINSPHVSRSSSPHPNDWQRDLLQMSKSRYLQLNCPSVEIRRSYDLKKLLQLQELQRRQLQIVRESKELSTEIQQRCMHCITKDQLLCKPRNTSLSGTSTLHQYQRHSMGRALSVLLAEQQQISPHALLRAQKLEQQLETLRSKQRLLQTERDTYEARITQQRQRLNVLIETREQLQKSLNQRQEQLQYDKEVLDENYQQQMALQQRKRHIVQQMERRMSSLCLELCEIYPISRNQQGFHTICNVPFPNVEAYVMDAKYASSISNMENVMPMALSVSLGYIAHLVQMISVIINRPLRNPIIHEGSRSRIMDIVKEIPYTSREFPLYSRSSIPPKSVKYAIFLLNQNVAQLCYDITGLRCDFRATIENILHIFQTLTEIEQNQGNLREATSGGTPPTLTHPNRRLVLHTAHSSSGNGCVNSTNSLLSKSHSSVDMNHMPVPVLTNATTTTLKSLLQLPSSQPLPIAESNARQPRVCRSVGSYSEDEDDFKDISAQCYSNSDSNITLQTGHV